MDTIDLKNSDLFLIRVPASIDAKKLSGLKFDPAAAETAEGSTVGNFTVTYGSADEARQCVPFFPSGEAGHLALGKPFTAVFNVTEKLAVDVPADATSAIRRRPRVAVTPANNARSTLAIPFLSDAPRKPVFGDPLSPNFTVPEFLGGAAKPEDLQRLLQSATKTAKTVKAKADVKKTTKTVKKVKKAKKAKK